MIEIQINNTDGNQIGAIQSVIVPRVSEIISGFVTNMSVSHWRVINVEYRVAAPQTARDDPKLFGATITVEQVK